MTPSATTSASATAPFSSTYAINKAAALRELSLLVELWLDLVQSKADPACPAKTDSADRQAHPKNLEWGLRKDLEEWAAAFCLRLGLE